MGPSFCPRNEDLERFRAAFERLGSTAPTIDNPAFGRLTHAQWIALNLRHSELHLGFFDELSDLEPSSSAQG